MVEGVPQVLEAAGNRFLFNFDQISENDSIMQFQAGSGQSLTLCLVLESKLYW